ncbi:MAG: hypothetical protein KF859_09135 [Phycisphaeraceae bacterium]|nr:hypothetical protein [Phycisphaeraceae bacterium]
MSASTNEPSNTPTPLPQPPASPAPASGVPAFQGPHQRRPTIKPPLLRPRKVRGGVKVPAGDVAPASAWAAQRWLRLVESVAPGSRLVEGLDYAREGQTKRLNITTTGLDAAIQGRADRPYATTISFGVFSHDQWDKVVEAMTEGSLYAAKLLAGELSPNVEDIFAPLDLKLFPVEAQEVFHTCTCFEWRADNAAGASGTPRPTAGVWCKHVCCAAYLLAHRLSAEPFAIFMMRGIDGQELLERLRQRRAAASAGAGVTPVYQQRIPGLAEAQWAPLESCIEHFWDAPSSLYEVDMPISPPPVSHPLLRRLGQSPFLNAPFPLVGLLASCYDTVSQHAAADPAAPPPAPQEPDPEED